jgi:hypothetical protein
MCQLFSARRVVVYAMFVGLSLHRSIVSMETCPEDGIKRGQVQSVLQCHRCLLCGLFYDAINCSECTASLEGWLVNKEQERIGKERLAPKTVTVLSISCRVWGYLTSLWASTACYRESFTLLFLLLNWIIIIMRWLSLMWLLVSTLCCVCNWPCSCWLSL